MYVWVIRHCLTQGLYQLEVSQPDKKGFVTPLDTSNRMSLKMNMDCFERKEVAEIEAEHRRDAKIRQLKRQLAKLEKLVFYKVD